MDIVWNKYIMQIMQIMQMIGYKEKLENCK